MDSIRTRTRCAAILIPIVIAGILPAYPKTPAQLVTDLDKVFGAKEARIVFQSSVAPTESQTAILQKVDSRDGVVKDFLVNPPANGFLSHPTFTMDGNRVIFTDINSATTYIAKWSDGTYTKVSSTYQGESSFRNSSGKDMLLCGKTGVNTLYLIDVDNSTSATTVYSGSDSPGYISISGDGKYIAANWNGYGTAGIYEIGGTGGVQGRYCTLFSGADAQLTSPNLCEGGCWVTISRDNVYNVLYTVEPHAGFVIQNGSKKVMDKVLPFAVHVGEYNGLCWSNDQNFISCFMDGDAGTNNPYIVRVSDLTYAYLIDTPPGLPGVSGMYVYDPTSIVKQPEPLGARSLSRGFASAKTCDFQGRSVRGGVAAKPGVYLRATVAGAGARKGVISMMGE